MLEHLCLYIIFDQRRVLLDSIDHIELWSPRQVTHVPPVWDILLPLAYTPDRRDQRILVYLPKDTGKVGRGGEWRGGEGGREGRRGGKEEVRGRDGGEGRRGGMGEGGGEG